MNTLTIIRHLAAVLAAQAWRDEYWDGKFPGRKLSQRQRAAIRRSTRNYREIAERYGISPNYVHQIRRGVMSERRTGRTQRMLEEIAASDAEQIFVFAVNHIGVRDMLWRVREMLPNCTRTREDELTRADGRRIRFYVHSDVPGRNEERMRGALGVAFTDHAVYEI